MFNNFSLLQDCFIKQQTKKMFQLQDEEIYEWQTEIYFDDAFKLEKPNSKKQVVQDQRVSIDNFEDKQNLIYIEIK